MEISVYKMQCVACNGVFFEIEGEEEDECPACGSSLLEERHTVELGDNLLEILIDPKTGDLSLKTEE